MVELKHPSNDSASSSALAPSGEVPLRRSSRILCCVTPQFATSIPKPAKPIITVAARPWWPPWRRTGCTAICRLRCGAGL